MPKIFLWIIQHTLEDIRGHMPCNYYWVTIEVSKIPNIHALTRTRDVNNLSPAYYSHGRYGTQANPTF